MFRTFIEVPPFTKRWNELGLTDEDLLNLQLLLLKNPEAGPVIRGTGGVRKLRFAFDNRGKSGSARVCYVDFEEFGTIYLITVYAKAKKESLTAEEKNILEKLVKTLKEEAAKGRR